VPENRVQGIGLNGTVKNGIVAVFIQTLASPVKGLYAHCDGKYDGIAFFGTGGGEGKSLLQSFLLNRTSPLLIPTAILTPLRDSTRIAAESTTASPSVGVQDRK